MISTDPNLRSKTAFQKLEKKLLEIILRPWVRWYTSSDRAYRYKDISIHIKSGVFHPGLFFSTKILLRHLATLELKGKKILELGAGTGLMSIYAASCGAQVTASDINPLSVQNILENISKNQELLLTNSGEVKVIQSDLFKNIKQERYDLILLNPPFYRGEIRSESDYAWYCGPDLDFFKGLFSSLKHYAHPASTIMMILSQDTEIKQIIEVATQHDVSLECIHREKNLLEVNYIYRIVPGYSIQEIKQEGR